MQPRLVVVPLELKEANTLVRIWHRHHKPVQGHRFSIGALNVETEHIVGAAIVGRPVARLTDFRNTLEVSRLVTDGTPNACSFLYGASARIGKEMGYARIQTFILESETGLTLKASGWLCDGISVGGQWEHTDGKPRRTDQPTVPKQRWYKVLRETIYDIENRNQTVDNIENQIALM